MGNYIHEYYIRGSEMNYNSLTCIFDAAAHVSEPPAVLQSTALTTCRPKKIRVNKNIIQSEQYRSGGFWFLLTRMSKFGFAPPTNFPCAYVTHLTNV